MSDRETQHSQLANAAVENGIELTFRNARGEIIHASDRVKKQLLESMGIEIDNLATEVISQPECPPVIVATVASDGGCTIEVPAKRQPSTWKIKLESGGTRTGFLPSELSGANSRLLIDDVPFGYHTICFGDVGVETRLIVSPEKCWLPPALAQGGRLWGLSVQLYLLRSNTNWGIGDFADLKALVEIAAKRGCSTIGLNPLHQMFLDNPGSASPYSSLSRLYLNVLYISIPNVPGFEDEAVQQRVGSVGFKTRLDQCRNGPKVDYETVASIKLEALRCIYDNAKHRGDLAAFEKFVAAEGEPLHRTSIFQLLRQKSNELISLSDSQYQRTSADGLAVFELAEADEISFQKWLQWIAHLQLENAAEAAERAGMSIGLYRDLAVGCDRSGAETWTDADAFLNGVSVGAPPDIFNPAGQNWGLPPLNPAALQAHKYDTFINLIRANMKYAGALRIDHVMGLQRLYCIPDGNAPADGAYLRYPIDDLISILALESHRNECLLIGEDLGTVPDGFREKMADANILSYRVLFFEQDWEQGNFIPPERYPALSLAVAGNHDLPTLLGWWQGRDIEEKHRLRLYPSEKDMIEHQTQRTTERLSLIKALDGRPLLHESDIAETEFLASAHEYLASTRSVLAIPQFDDLLGELEQVNVPATFQEYPNWRRKYEMTLEQAAESDEIWDRLGRLPEIRSGR